MESKKKNCNIIFIVVQTCCSVIFMKDNCMGLNSIVNIVSSRQNVDWRNNDATTKVAWLIASL